VVGIDHRFADVKSHIVKAPFRLKSTTASRGSRDVCAGQRPCAGRTRPAFGLDKVAIGVLVEVGPGGLATLSDARPAHHRPERTR
jgi:hypothetical protein